MKKKIGFFEVKPKTDRFLTWTLVLYLAFEALVEIGDYIGLARVSNGAVAYGISRITQSGVGHVLLSLVCSGFLVFIWEWFRRGLQKVNSLLRYLVLAIMTLIVCDFLVSLAPDSSANTLEQIVHPSRFVSFAESFRNVSDGVQSVLLLVLSCSLIYKFKGRIRTYGIVNLICMLGGGFVTGWLYMLFFNLSTNGFPQGLALAFVFLRYVAGVLPYVFLRRTLINRTVKESGEEDDI